MTRGVPSGGNASLILVALLIWIAACLALMTRLHCTALARGDIESAQRYFAAARPDIEKRVSDNLDVAEHHSQLGLLYAFMRRKEDAIREGRRAFELEPESQDAFHGTIRAANLALVSALVGEPDQAITLIERLLSTPGAASYPVGRIASRSLSFVCGGNGV